MKYRFTKMHGISNDYIYFNCFEQDIPDPAALSVRMSPRHSSVGADGIVLICPSDCADARMRMFNADGSEGRMCGNAIRCVGKYLYDNRMVQKKHLRIETLSGIRDLLLHVQGDRVRSVTVDMGVADFSPAAVPLAADSPFMDRPVMVLDREWNITALSVGNPHAVCFVEDVDALDLERIGPYFENHPLFPERVNTEFVQLLPDGALKMRVYERGSGETWACGTGACAAVAAAARNRLVGFGRPVDVHLIGGVLSILCDTDYRIQMTGPAQKVYEGVYDDED